jgi:hypothetical protein
MALPYPHEVETGRLPSLAPAHRAPLDVGHLMHEAIQRDGPNVNVFGVRLRVSDSAAVGATVQRLRDTLTEHLQKKRAQADAATWEAFTERARATAERFTMADDELLEALAAEIDGL